jgi:hypothetical protein
MKLRVFYTPHFDAIVLVRILKPTKAWAFRCKIVEGHQSRKGNEFMGVTFCSRLKKDRVCFLPDSVDLGEL